MTIFELVILILSIIFLRIGFKNLEERKPESIVYLITGGLFLSIFISLILTTEI